MQQLCGSWKPTLFYVPNNVDFELLNLFKTNLLSSKQYPWQFLNRSTFIGHIFFWTVREYSTLFNAKKFQKYYLILDSEVVCLFSYKIFLFDDFSLYISHNIRKCKWTYKRNSARLCSEPDPVNSTINAIIKEVKSPVTFFLFADDFTIFVLFHDITSGEKFPIKNNEQIASLV